MLRLTLLAMCLFLSAAFGAQSFLNIMDGETGDFGGLSFPLRSEITPFIQEGVDGTVTKFGFTIPSLERLGFVSLPTNLPPFGVSLNFDVDHLAYPEQFPFKFIGINYNPGGHPTEEYEVAHFDIHLWLKEPEFARGIECNDTAVAPCVTTTYLASRFSKNAPASQLPAGYFNVPEFWVPTMGAHILPPTIPNTFATTPAFLFGSYNGELVYYEPMVAATVFQAAKEEPLEWEWPQSEETPTGGTFFGKIALEYSSDTDSYTFSFANTFNAPHTVNSVPVFTGAVLPASNTPVIAPVSSSKDCLIASGSSVDAGFLITIDGPKLCCRARGDLDGFSCTRSTCSGVAPVAISFYDETHCYTRCHLP